MAFLLFIERTWGWALSNYWLRCTAYFPAFLLGRRIISLLAIVVILVWHKINKLPIEVSTISWGGALWSCWLLLKLLHHHHHLLLLIAWVSSGTTTSIRRSNDLHLRRTGRIANSIWYIRLCGCRKWAVWDLPLLLCIWWIVRCLSRRVKVSILWRWLGQLAVQRISLLMRH